MPRSMQHILAITIAACIDFTSSEKILQQTYVYEMGSAADVNVKATFLISLKSGESLSKYSKSISAYYLKRPPKSVEVKWGPSGGNLTNLDPDVSSYDDGVQKLRVNFPRVTGPAEYEMRISFTVSPGLCLDRAREGRGARVVMYSKWPQWWGISVEKTIFKLVFPSTSDEDVCMIPEGDFGDATCKPKGPPITDAGTSTFVFERNGKSNSEGFSWLLSVYGDGVDLPGCDGYDDSSAFLPTTPLWKGSSVLQANAIEADEQTARHQALVGQVRRKHAKSRDAFLATSMMQIMQYPSLNEQTTGRNVSERKGGKLEL